MMLTMEVFAIIESIVSAILLAGLAGAWHMFRGFVTEQKKTNKLMSESIASMQREVILRGFQRHIEDKKPISLEEMEHITNCYKAYIASGHDGPIEIMYEKIHTYATITTKKAENQ